MGTHRDESLAAFVAQGFEPEQADLLVEAGMVCADAIRIREAGLTRSDLLYIAAAELSAQTVLDFIALRFSLDEALSLGEAGLGPEDAARYSRFGLDTESMPKAWAAGVTPVDYADYRSAGILDLDDMIAIERAPRGLHPERHTPGSQRTDRPDRGQGAQEPSTPEQGPQK
jgi:hypothetical protein